MSIDAETANKLIHDIQVAHRLVVGFYQRIIPLLDHISEEMKFEFSYWRPLYTSRPALGTTQPSKNWFWDMVPLYASRHVYRMVEGGRLHAADKAIVFDIHVDEGFNAARANGEPDPIEFEKGEATLRIDLYRATAESEESFDTVWKNTKDAKRELDDWHHVHTYMEGRSLKVDLGRFISNHEATVNTLRGLFFPGSGGPPSGGTPLS